MFDDVHLVPEDGRAVAVFTMGAERRAALADALSWYVTRRFQAGNVEEADDALELRAAGALADRLDAHRDVEGRAPVRLTSDQARMLIEASSEYRSERDTEGYQPPEERSRLAELQQLIDPLFDLVTDLDQADRVLAAQSI